MSRLSLTDMLAPGSVGIELGVAEGEFAHSLMATGKFRKLYGVDMYAGDRGHDEGQHAAVLRRMSGFGARYQLIKARFEDVVKTFPDRYFDFIYVDGYAHTGEEGGSTFKDWWPKLKPGGLFAGHDYSKDYPLVVEAVDAFAASVGAQVHVVFDDSAGWNCGMDSWYLR